MGYILASLAQITLFPIICETLFQIIAAVLEIII